MHTDKASFKGADRRKQERSTVDYDSIIIFDLETAKRMGQMLNLTQGGFLLKSEQSLEISKNYRISMSIPELVNQKSVVRCIVRCLWGDEVKGLWDNKANLPDCYWSGFEFIALNEEDSKTIALLTDKLSESP